MGFFYFPSSFLFFIRSLIIDRDFFDLTSCLHYSLYTHNFQRLNRHDDSCNSATTAAAFQVVKVVSVTAVIAKKDL